jgi:Plastocyanin-like domain
MELKTKGEFESCKTHNPIKMYTEGLNQVTLDSEGSRYFTSTNPENCKKGLKLHVKVLPVQQTEHVAGDASYIALEVLAEGPSTSHAKYYKGCSLLVWFASAFVFFFSLV